MRYFTVCTRESDVAILPQRHRNLKLRKAGFYIGEPGYLGASPDGVLFSSSRTEVGILEIKCTIQPVI